MRKIRCPLCGRRLAEADLSSCPNCGNQLKVHEYNGYHRLEESISDAQHKLDVLMEDLYSRNEMVQDNYKTDIRNGVVTDPRGINE